MITDKFKTKFSELVKKFENEKLKIYDDDYGVPTIGIGFALINKMKDKEWKAYEKDFLEKLELNLTDKQYKIIEAYADLKSKNGKYNQT